MAKKKRNKNFHLFETRLADTITRFSGSMVFVYLHTVWFALWLVFFPHQVELLTLIVSLEAIYLSTFILVSQNREREITEERMLEEDKEDEETQEDIEDIQEDVQGIEKDIDVIQENFGEVQEDIDEIKKLILRLEEKVTHSTPQK